MTWDPFAKPKLAAAPVSTVHRLRDDDERDPDRDPTDAEELPYLVSDSMGNPRITRQRKLEPPMPKGIYDRKPKEVIEGEPAKPPRKAKAKRAAIVATNGSGQKPAPFSVALDLRAGAVTINASAGSLTLAPDEVMALFAFIGRR
jgi:hypothetical protein